MPGTKLYQVYNSDGTKRSEVSVVVSDAELRLEAAITRLVQGRSQLRQIRDQAQTASSGGAFANLTAASTAIRQLAGAVATLTQTLMDIELILAHQQDDGLN